MKKTDNNLGVEKEVVNLQRDLSSVYVHYPHSFKDKPCIVACEASSETERDRQQCGAILFMAFIPSEKKLTYREKLEDNRWQRIKNAVQRRDNFTCRECGATDKPVQVHHDKYHGNPWDSPMDSLRLLCKDCHYKTHFPITPDPNENLTPIERAEKLISDLEKKILSGKFGDRAIKSWTQAIVFAQNEIERIISTTQTTHAA